MKPYLEDESVRLYLGEALDVLPTLPDSSVDAIVCDPPYALTELPTTLVTDALTAWLTGDRAHVPAAGRGFMGRDWDRFVPPPAIWDECLRVLKPGGHLAAFAGARTVDLMGLSIRLAGLQIRDSIDWINGAGMPKGKHQLKPAHEPIILARKPLAGTVAATILAHGTGGLNIDGCRTAAGQDYRDKCASVVGLSSNRNGDTYGEWTGTRTDSAHDAGRWPTNVILSHLPLVDEHGRPAGDACADGCVPDGCPVAELDQQTAAMRASKPSKTGSGGKGGGTIYGGGKSIPKDGYVPVSRDDQGGASRFFPVFRYEPKAPTSERPRLADGTAWPTVKPLALMRWLVRLITPPGGTVLDWCAGTGTTLEAARLEDFPAIGVERDQTAAELCLVRLNKPYSVALFDGGAA
ncbi:DNA-methyltransferase [Streptomyces sp. NPDC056817]|uniref:DNA-methyltransferase n=1 Tax=Streptomyces sp. NPDC056817 TaxID=3345950 RepID=UPI0036927E01